MSSDPSTAAQHRTPPSEREESVLVAAQRTLAMVAGRASLNEILDDLCATIDAQSSGGVSMITLFDPDGGRLWPMSGPRVPKPWFEALGPQQVGPDQGACGTAAF